MSDSDQDGEAKPKRIADFAREYDVSERTVKRWNATGLSKSDPPPLESPELMRAWWSRNMKQAEPAGISAAAIRAMQSARANPAPVVPDSPPPISPPEDKAATRKAIMDIPVDDNSIGSEHTLRRLLELEPRLHRIADQPGQAKEYSAIVARIGPAAKALREENERMRKLIPRLEAETMIHAFHAPIERETRQLARALCEILGLPPSPLIMEAWNRECDRLFARFQQEVFR